MAKHASPPWIHLPRRWPRRVIALAQHAMAYTRSWAANGRFARIRLSAKNDQLLLPPTMMGSSASSRRGVRDFGQ